MKINKKSLNNQHGITLIVVILITMSVAIIAFGAVALNVQFGQILKKRQMSKRIYTVRDALKKYYKTRQDLPPLITSSSPGLVGPLIIPVETLGIDQEYRFDVWGQRLDYYIVKQNVTIDSTNPNVERTNINSFTIKNTPYQAAVLISGGPDQIIQSPVITSGSIYEINSAGTNDDIIVNINLTEEAEKIAFDELNIINKKLWAYWCYKMEKLFPGDSDNNSDYDDLQSFVNGYGLADNYVKDPWFEDYTLMPDFVSSFGVDQTDKTADDIKLRTLSKKCNDLTIPLKKLDFDDLGDPLLNVEGDVSLETEGEESALGFNLGAGGTGTVTLDNKKYYDFSRDDSFSFLAWIKTGSTNSPMTVISKMDNSGVGYALKIESGKICFKIEDDDGKDIDICGSIHNMTDDNCHHIAVTYDGLSLASGIKIYDNATLVTLVTDTSNAPLTGSILNGEPLRLSGYGTPPTELYQGILDEVVIYDTLIEQPEIKQVKEEFFGNRSSGEVWPFCENAEIVLYNYGSIAGNSIGGMNSADNLCANSDNRPTGYDNYRAFISTVSSPYQRHITNPSSFNPSPDLTLPIITKSGDVIAADWIDFTDGTISINLTNVGDGAGDSSVCGTLWWSGGDDLSTPPSTVNFDTCGDWNLGFTGNVGTLLQTDNRWFDGQGAGKNGCLNLNACMMCIAYDNP